MPEEKISLAGLSLSSLEEMMGFFGIDSRYSQRILYWIYKRGISSFEPVDDIPKLVIGKISEHFIPGIFSPESSVKSDDGSVKYLFRNSDGLLYESVYIPDGKRQTLCVSVQSGCRMGCHFCATGSYGWHGNLTAGEIVNQVISVPHEITNVVFMGMGEPCDNVEEVIQACEIFTSEWGLAKGKANVTVSTVGVMPGLERLLKETGCNITLSLHSPFSEERASLIPAEKLWPSGKILEMIKEISNFRKRRFTVAYIMIEGFNDTDRHLEALKALLEDSGIRVNLIPYHNVSGDSLRSSSAERMMFFKHKMVISGIGASIRKSRGTDVSAACGMLAVSKANKRK